MVLRSYTYLFPHMCLIPLTREGVTLNIKQAGKVAGVVIGGTVYSPGVWSSWNHSPACTLNYRQH